MVHLLSSHVFWSLWDQSSGGAWTLQCKNLNLHVGWLPRVDVGFSPLHFSTGFRPESSCPNRFKRSQSLSLILLFIPLVNYILYPALGQVFEVTPLRKIGIGLAITGASYLVIAHIQTLIDAGNHPTVSWQFLAYIILTLGEAMVSITGLEFSYTQAPNKMKSAIAALWLFAVSVGNVLYGVWSTLSSRNKDRYVQDSVTTQLLHASLLALMFVTTAHLRCRSQLFIGAGPIIQGEAEKLPRRTSPQVVTRMPA